MYTIFFIFFLRDVGGEEGGRGSFYILSTGSISVCRLACGNLRFRAIRSSFFCSIAMEIQHSFTLQYSTVQYRTVPYRTVPYSTVQYSTRGNQDMVGLCLLMLSTTDLNIYIYIYKRMNIFL